MLRSIVLAIGAVGFAGGLVGIFAGGFPPGYVGLFWGALIIVGVLCERVIYKPIVGAAPGAGWRRTPERFVDDRTGRAVTVYVRPDTGERTYVHE